MNIRDAAYQIRMLKVLYYIDQHLEQDLSVESLSAVAAFSKFHFHRQFSDYFGIAVIKYVQLLRLKKAAHVLAFRQHRQVIDIALESGYESSEAFSRAFKKSLGQSPAHFRKQSQWTAWQNSYLSLHHMREQHMSAQHQLDDVKIITFPATSIAVLEHRGDPALLNSSIQKFIAWRRQNKLSPSVSATFNLIYDDLENCIPSQYRFDLGAAVQTPVEENAAGIVNKIIPEGSCAVLRHTGSDALLGASIRFLYGQWLPQSGASLRDFPLFLQRLSFYPDVPEHQMMIDIFLPLN
ncbi:AraC family transcriptional regulator [Undibacterium sp. Ji50W]|uniref:AraC family transcriptional regulator n=1 Tax=Undibacterium sp. Ji50W TaxID=3413041 RepID=UPI003BEFB55E